MKRIHCALFACMLTLVALIGLYHYLFNTFIPLKTPPSDLQCNVEGGTITLTSSWDSIHGYVDGTELVLEDGSTVYVIMFSLADPPARKLFPRHYHTPDPIGIGGTENGMNMQFSSDEWDGGVYRVYFIQEREVKKGRIEIDETTGKLTEASMQYATLVWEETID